MFIAVDSAILFIEKLEDLAHPQDNIASLLFADGSPEATTPERNRSLDKIISTRITKSVFLPVSFHLPLI